VYLRLSRALPLSSRRRQPVVKVFRSACRAAARVAAGAQARRQIRDKGLHLEAVVAGALPRARRREV